MKSVRSRAVSRAFLIRPWYNSRNYLVSHCCAVAQQWYTNNATVVFTVRTKRRIRLHSCGVQFAYQDLRASQGKEGSFQNKNSRMPNSANTRFL